MGWGFKIMWVHYNSVYRGDNEKLIYLMELARIVGEGGRGLDSFQISGGLDKKEWGVFLKGWRGDGDTPMHTMNLAITLTVILIYWC